MSFINQLSKHKIVEVNNMLALRTGNMIAQAKYTGTANGTLDNGNILFLNTVGDLVLAEGANAIIKNPYLHYTEELLTGPVSGNEYFTLELDADGVGYPRALALTEGDEFTTSNFETALTLANNTVYYGIIGANEIISVVAAIPATPYVGPLFVAKKDTLAAGQAAVNLVLIDKYYVGV